MQLVLLVFLLGFIGLSCQKPAAVTPDSLTGVWVEKSGRRDTLIFNPSFQGNTLPNTLTVNRGKEINAGGYALPKIGSGIYQYELRGKRIYVQNGLSSRYQGEEYALERIGDELRVENFFELGFNQPATAVRTLIQLR
ncbi:hypothetical protein [Spirosoma utsteinense]|uniref:Lipocalin-like domain-containing protein n=1 Tax=Spirosoma utsteinense TaxID=2585773 RepID=A0ABR6W6W3_9BACT|nr:hypothetical protein [Spirosoma utsteinense]MBC3786267.1 hypothetical protein [Spirosoma utsteinense]MBC3791893.1 hypothetical protein [Spirosoma utsteinense]